MIAKCCMCNTTEGGIYLVRNPWGDIHFLCEPCSPKWDIFWGEEE